MNILMESDSDFDIGSQTLKAIEEQENEERKRVNESIEGSQDILESPACFSYQHKSLSDRMRLATQKQVEKRKFGKTKSDSNMIDSKRNFEFSSLSRIIHKEIADVDLSAW